MAIVKKQKSIEESTVLSKSSLWSLQEQYFLNKGISAWDDEIPYYVSNSVLTGFQYAELICKLILDLKQHQNLPEKLYIVEVGGGCGKLAYHFLRQFNQLLQEYGISQSYQYIYTDLAQKNLDNLKESEIFDEYFKQGVLDSAIFNLRTDTDFTLSGQGVSFSSICDGLCVFIANYAFDCLPHDGFAKKDDTLLQTHVTLTSRFDTFNPQTIKYINDVNLSFKNIQITSRNVYAEPHRQKVLDQILSSIKEKDANFLMPVGPMQALDTFSKLTNNNYFLIAGDKGFSQESRYAYWSEKYRCTYDGCYSFAVNFAALKSYIQLQGGGALVSASEATFKSNIFYSKAGIQELPLVKQHYEHNIDRFGPCELCDVYEDVAVHGYRFSLSAILSLLKLSYWDPQLYHVLHARILELLPVTDEINLLALEENIRKIIPNVYPIKIEPDVYLQLSEFYTQFNYYINSDVYVNLALQMAELSAKVHEEGTAHNYIGALCEDQSNINKAIQHYEHAVKLNKKDTFAMERLHALNGKPYLNMVKPIMRGALVAAILGVVVYWLTM